MPCISHFLLHGRIAIYSYPIVSRGHAWPRETIATLGPKMTEKSHSILVQLIELAVEFYLAHYIALLD